MYKRLSQPSFRCQTAVPPFSSDPSLKSFPLIMLIPSESRVQFFTVEVKREVVDVKSIPAWENKHLPGKAAGGQEDRHVSRCLPCPLAMHRGPCGLHSEPGRCFEDAHYISISHSNYVIFNMCSIYFHFSREYHMLT